MFQTMFLTLYSLLIWVGICLFTLFYTLSILIVGAITGPMDPKRFIPHSMANFWAKWIVAMNPFWRVKVQRNIQLDPNRAYILVSNHQSIADVVAIGHLGYQFKWISKASVFNIFVFGWAMKMAGYIPLIRGDKESIIHCIEQAKSWLQRGVSVSFMPEGTRSSDGTVIPFKSGAFRLSKEMGVSIVPIAIHGSGDAIPKGSWRFEGPVNIHVYVADPLDPLKFESVDALKEVARQKIIENLSRLERL